MRASLHEGVYPRVQKVLDSGGVTGPLEGGGRGVTRDLLNEVQQYYPRCNCEEYGLVFVGQTLRGGPDPLLRLEETCTPMARCPATDLLLRRLGH